MVSTAGAAATAVISRRHAIQGKRLRDEFPVTCAPDGWALCESVLLSCSEFVLLSCSNLLSWPSRSRCHHSVVTHTLLVQALLLLGEADTCLALLAGADGDRAPALRAAAETVQVLHGDPNAIIKRAILFLVIKCLCWHGQ